ncbi:MAG: hypothetical protein CEN92_58 [Candidatus Berkelbacteria bacterium Licking1014_96]|uniref:Uncharacterized protein n=1 Tax=Candidatus Berkelbacteria bacterium Licking1014_96 TaxID=2017149 RepID=A0A554LH98_9BACT|nr:MAG: hypothetical protein CEN92_58 [Candidatus Berkelbacteria bacterium Licking1014_96]
MALLIVVVIGVIVYKVLRNEFSEDEGVNDVYTTKGR